MIIIPHVMLVDVQIGVVVVVVVVVELIVLVVIVLMIVVEQQIVVEQIHLLEEKMLFHIEHVLQKMDDVFDIV
jgi:hypothetical protein